MSDPAAPPPPPPPSESGLRDLPRSFYVDAAGKSQRDLSVADISRIISQDESGQGNLWVDVDVTNRHHVAVLENACKFHPLSIEDTLNPNSRVKLEEYPGYLFMI